MCLLTFISTVLYSDSDVSRFPNRAFRWLDVGQEQPVFDLRQTTQELDMTAAVGTWEKVCVKDSFSLDEKKDQLKDGKKKELRRIALSSVTL